jgi:hypothetical protein
MKVKGGRRERDVKRLKVTKVGRVTGMIEVNIDQTKCMVRCRDQNARPSRCVENGNSSFESVEQFKCMGQS